MNLISIFLDVIKVRYDTWFIRPESLLGFFATLVDNLKIMQPIISIMHVKDTIHIAFVT